ncbi:MAG: SprB repeat-containing protein, partial [Flavobacteriales bacterium]|nr:SprB repeat-containing protein [Flavobacteriales bacterium]
MLLLLGTVLGIALSMSAPLRTSAQTVDLGPPDTSVCNGQPITLNAITSGVITQPTFTAIDIPSDDVHSSVLDIGFPFEFFGNTYTQCVASSNGYVTFDLTTAGTGSPWNITAASPTPGVPDNSIMFPWQDIYPSTNPEDATDAADCGDGTFIVDFVDIAMFSCTDLNFTMQVKLYEGTNIIETYISEKPLCTTWNGGAAIHGLENIGGTQSVIVPGRNFPTQWTANNDAVRFTPDGFGSYVIDQTIPFNPTPVGSESIEWMDDQGTVLGITNSITVTPVIPTWYYCTYQSACSAITVTDSILVTLGNVDIAATSTDASCFGFSDGFVDVDPVGSTFPVTLGLFDAATLTPIQQIPGVNGVDVIGGISAGDYVVTVTDGVGCQTALNVTIGEPTLMIPNAGRIDILCNGDDNGRAYSSPSGGVGPYQLSWNDALAQTTDTIEFLPAGAYTITVTDAQDCVSDTTVTVYEPLPLVIELSSGADTCELRNGAILTQMQGGTQPYNYI